MDFLRGFLVVVLLILIGKMGNRKVMVKVRYTQTMANGMTIWMVIFIALVNIQQMHLHL